MKKGLALVITVLLAALCVTPALGEGAADRLMTDWLLLLHMRDDCLTQQNDALEIILDYCEENTWENLVRARAATAYTCEVIDDYAHCEAEQTMTAEDYAALAEQGMDVADVKAEIELYNADDLIELRNVTLPFWKEYLMGYLIERAFDRYTLADIAAEAKQRIQENESTLRFLYLINNYIALELPSADAQTLGTLAARYAPGVMGMYDAALSSVNDVLNEMEREISRDEELVLQRRALVSANEAGAEAEASRVESGEAQFAADELVILPDLPDALPLPAAWDGGRVRCDYSWVDAKGDATAMDKRMTMDGIPNCVTLMMPGATVDEYKAYVAELADRGALPTATDMDETGAFYDLEGGVRLIVDWYADGLTITVRNGQIAFLPHWYIEALQIKTGRK